MTICIFTGPTLSPRDASSILDADYRPPAAHGDVFRAAKQGPVAIGIIDGYFQNIPSVWHKEILWAMAEGIHVFGSASMGALRAAELHVFGMVGVGSIFADYADGVLNDDDEVAVIHGPPETGYVALSEAMVNIRATLNAAQRDSIISEPTCSQLLSLAKRTFFPRRSYEQLLAGAAALDLPAGELSALRAWLPGGKINRKRLDAVQMLEAMREFGAETPPPKIVRYHLERTYLFDQDGH